MSSLFGCLDPFVLKNTSFVGNIIFQGCQSGHIDLTHYVWHSSLPLLSFVTAGIKKKALKTNNRVWVNIGEQMQKSWRQQESQISIAFFLVYHPDTVTSSLRWWLCNLAACLRWKDKRKSHLCWWFSFLCNELTPLSPFEILCHSCLCIGPGTQHNQYEINLSLCISLKLSHCNMTLAMGLVLAPIVIEKQQKKEKTCQFCLSN